MRVWLAFLMVSPALCVPAMAKPSRIVSLDRGADEFLLLLADRDRIAAVTWLAPAPDVSNVVEQAKGIPTTRCSAEEIAMLKPELVITGQYTKPIMINMLRQFKIPCQIVSFPASFDDIRRQLRDIAGALGEADRGRELQSRMDERLARVAMQRRKDKPLVVLYFQDGYTAGTGTLANAIIEAAGAENLAAKLGLKGYVRLPMEQMIVNKPRYLILTDYILDSNNLGQEMLEHPAVHRVVPHQNIIMMPARLMSCISPIAIEAVEILDAALRMKS